MSNTKIDDGNELSRELQRNVRELEAQDAGRIVDYFLGSDHAFLQGMGVDPAKLPKPAVWLELILADLDRPVEKKDYFCLIWEIEGQPIGHSNINKIVYGDHAYMHLHLWQPGIRKTGHGSWFVRKSIDQYFAKFSLTKLFSEPYALNPAPNRTLPKCGFTFRKRYETTPGWINFQQEVNRWKLTREDWFGKSRSED